MKFVIDDVNVPVVQLVGDFVLVTLDIVPIREIAVDIDCMNHGHHEQETGQNRCD